MKTVSNKTQRPLSVPLPRGKKLHLGPGKTGQISSEAAEHQQVKKLIDAGEIEVFDDASAPTGRAGGGMKERPTFYGHSTSSGGRRSGDRCGRLALREAQAQGFALHSPVRHRNASSVAPFDLSRGGLP